MLSKFTALGLALLLTAGVPAQAADVEGPQIRFSPHVGGGLWTSDVDLSGDLLYGGRVALNPVPYFGFEGTFDFNPTQSASAVSTTVTHLSGNLIMNFAPNHRVNPYVTGGWSQLNFDPEGGNQRSFPGWEVGGGLKIRLLGEQGRQVDLRLDARSVFTNFEAPYPTESTQSNTFVAAGVEFSLGGPGNDSDQDGVPDRRDMCASTPLNAVVDDQGCTVDGDDDGIADGIDQCPQTPFGAEVDPVGCLKDDDGDLVANGIDRCPDTQVGVLVDAYGCAKDGDGDGVPDGLDQCPNTGAMVTVDSFGCAADSDGDGVTDDLDFCPDTATGIEVNDEGCPLDGDGDGVLDSEDACLDTPAGVKVDESGCTLVETEEEREFLDTGTLRLNNVYFESSKATLKPESFASLDLVGAILVKWPQLRVEIAGHTDSQGPEEFNRTLSEARAQAVYDYIGTQFPQIELGQFTVKGYGESRSIATNDTPVGRARNRRVEFTVLNREVLSR